MAPVANTGAAHPVGGAGEAIEGVMKEKAREDAAATIRALASQRGRDPGLAEQAVVESRAFTAQEALEKGLVDLVVPDFDALLAALDGREVRKGEQVLTLRTAGLSSIHNIRIVKRLEFIPLLGTGKTDYRALKESLAGTVG